MLKSVNADLSFPCSFCRSGFWSSNYQAAFVESPHIYTETYKLHRYVEQRDVETVAVSQTSGASPQCVPREEKLPRRACKNGS